MNDIKNKFIKRRMNYFSLIFSFLIFFSLLPWPVWGLGVWNMRVISIITLIISFRMLTEYKLKKNIFLASLYFISVLYMSFGGIKGYLLPTHVELSIFIFLLSLSKDFLVLILFKFEKLITVIFLLGIITYLISLIVSLPSFSIPPLNPSKTGNYMVRIFDLQLLEYTIANSRKFMSVFDEPGVVGTLVALLISYRKINYNKIRDIILIVAGLLSFSLAFYIVLLINIFYNRTLNLKIYLIFIIILGGFYYLKHVENANGRARFNVTPKVELITNQGFKPADLKLAEAIIEENKTIIIKKWEEFHG